MALTWFPLVLSLFICPGKVPAMRTLVYLALGLPALSLSAQDGIHPPAPEPRPPAFTGKALAGKRPGTERWIVHCKTRAWSFDAYRAEMWGERDPDKVDVIVQDIIRKMKAQRAPLVEAIEALGGEVVASWWIVNAMAIEIAPKHLGAIQKLPNVAYLQPDVEVFPLIKTATNANNHNADALQAAGFTGANVGCAVIDTGFDVNMAGSGKIHVTFSTRGNRAQSRFCRQLKVGTQPFDDVHGHGTGVASIVAGWKWGSTTADYGHVYDAQIAGYSIANSTSGSSSTTHMATSYNDIGAQAARCKIMATNLSYTGSSNPLSVEQKAMDSIALNANVLNCTAAGNAGTNVSFSLANVNGLSVGACNENVKTLASFSSRGMQGGRYFPNICANGVGTNMARRDNESTDYIASGTSMASPQVCGAVTQIRGINTSMKVDETRAVMLASTLQNAGAGSTIKVTGPGAGYLKNDCASDIARDSTRHGRATLSKPGQTIRRNIVVKMGETVQCAIAWNRHDVNSTSWSNLDLRLKRGNTVLVNSDSALNTEEFVRYQATATEVLVAEVALVSLGTGANQQEFGWACKQTTRDGGGGKLGRYIAFGTGCKGSGMGGSGPVCSSSNPNGGTLNQNHNTNTFALGVPATTQPRSVTGFELYTDSTTTSSLTINTQVYLANAAGQPTGAPVRTGTMTIGTTPGFYRTTFATLSVPANQKFFLSYSPNTSMRFPFLSSGALAEHFWRPPTSSSWRGPFSTVRWSWKVLCSMSSGAIPVLANNGVPEIGKSFQVTLAQARVNTSALLWLGGRTNLGLPGNCFLYTNLQVLLGVFPTGAKGTAAVTIPIPNARDLLCFKFANQWGVLDPQGALFSFLALTNGGEGEVGGS